MGILHRVHARHARAVWEAETRMLDHLGLVRPPLAVQWVATRACDLTCPHCYSHAGPRAADELGTDEAQRLIIDELAAMGCPSLVIAGGEPFLRRDLEQIVAHAVDRGLTWAFHAHGRLVPQQRSWLARLPPTMAAISLDGPEAWHDAFRGRTGAFADAVRAIRELRDLGVSEVIAGTTVTRRNADLVADLYPAVVASGAHGWGLHLFAPEGRGADQRALVPTPGQLRRVAAFCRRVRAEFPVELDNEWGSAGADDLYYRDQPFLCGAGRITCVVGPTGEVMPCTTTDPAESAGNVRDTALRVLWRDGFARFRRAGDATCADGRECWLQARNGNPCREHAFGPDAPQTRPPRAFEVWP